MGNAPSTAGDGPDTCEDVTDRTSALNFDLAFQIVRFCSTRDSASVACTCRALRDMQRDSDQMWWKPVTYQLARESKLYVSEIEHSGLPVSGGTWRREFFRLWTCRDRWREAAEEGDANGEHGDETPEDRLARLTDAEGEAFDARNEAARFEAGSIRVGVRMRPRGIGAAVTGPASDPGRGIVLPLHQRLRMIKAQRGAGTTTADAMRVLMMDSGRGEEASRSPWADAAPRCEKMDDDGAALGDLTNVDKAEKKQDDAAVKEKGIAEGYDFTCGILEVDERGGRVMAVAPGVGLREFAFDAVYSDRATQLDVYEQSARALVADVINGINATIVVYGQTGSGKTHTMFGELDQKSESRGLVPRACEEIFAAAADRKRGLGVTSEMAVSYVEIFGDEMTDLLRGGAPVGNSRVAGHGYILDGSTEIRVDDMEDVRRALEDGDAQKRRAATAMNARSSRAHAVFTVSLVQTDDETGKEMRSRLFLADLGGSERLKKSLAHEGVAAPGTVSWVEYYESRRRLTEALNINSGLLALKRCVDALHEARKCEEEGTPPPHVPFHDSKLTALLAPALGGNSKTAVVVTCAQEHEHAAETTQSLRFGEKCSSVETRARVGADDLANAIAKLNGKIADCEEKIRAVERWETVKTTRRDEVEGKDEVVMTSKLVGAEDLREELEAMLAERRALRSRAAA
mmetsp:Transcript_4697/g.21388  ORF Transcript_4697/g.21388 Transcript_4697/m.21388 type:complete len:688 (+) Transcript_4697:74-2137(+)